MTPIVTIDRIAIKLESTNPTGSAKDRALPLQLDRLKNSGFTSAVISSSGNAAISASYWCSLEKIPLTVFVSPKILKAKVNLISKHLATIKSTPQPNSSAFRWAKEHHSYNLRQSTDPAARLGYRQIGVELLNQFPQVTSVFLPLGSGTTLLGLSDILPDHIKLFAVQPASYAPIASHFDTDFVVETESITDALSVKMLPQKEILLQILSSRGGGVVVQNSMAIESQKWLESHQLILCPETALALAGLHKLKTSSPQQVGDYPLIIATGVRRHE